MSEREFIQYLADKHGLSFEKVDLIIKNYFLSIVQLMTERKDDSSDRKKFRIIIPNFGSFYKRHGK